MADVGDVLARYYSAVWTAWDMEPVADLVTDDIVWKSAFVGEDQTGPDVLYAHMGAMKAGFPDLAATVSDVAADGNNVTARLRWQGTHEGHIWRTEGSGRTIDLATDVDASVVDGRLSRIVEAADWTEPRAQVGAPPPEMIEVADQRVIPCLRTDDWDLSRRFYCGVLGFRVLFEWRHGCDFPVYAGIERDGVQLHISEHTGDAQVGGSVNIGWPDVDTFYRQAVTNGLEGVDEPLDQPWGERSFNLRDPDGNNIAFSHPV
jgi:catechol 2,3-dioxygenase-like lactoylglutathione lyase family enzyme/predicted ester cyclase